MGWSLKEMEWLQPSLVLSPDVRPCLWSRARTGQEGRRWAGEGRQLWVGRKWAGNHQPGMSVCRPPSLQLTSGGFKWAQEDNTRYQLTASHVLSRHVTCPFPIFPPMWNQLNGSEFCCCAFCVCASMFPPAHWEPKQFLSSLASNNALHCYQWKLKIFSQQFPQQQQFFPCSPFRRPICGS